MTESPRRNEALGFAMRAAYTAAGAVVGAITLFRSAFAAGDASVRLAERRGLWAGHAGDRRPWIWIHAASVGEAEIAVAVAGALGEALRKDSAAVRPLPRMVVSSMTAGGRARLEREPDIESHYFPIDFAPFARKVLGSCPPLLFVAVETEIWPATLAVVASAGVPMAVVNARLSDESFPRYRRLRPLLAPVLACVAKVAARDETSASRWISIGTREAVVEVTGNIKFDLVTMGNAESCVPLFTEEPGAPLLLAASTHEGEEAFALAAFAALRRTRPSARLLLAPRHPSRAAASGHAATSRGFTLAKWSDIYGVPDIPALWPRSTDVVVLDRLGLLKRAYRGADSAFLGGSMEAGPGGHNLLEAVVAGCPFATGEHLENVADQAEVLGEAGCLHVLREVDELSKFWLEVLENPADFASRGDGARALLRARSGALSRTVASLLPLLVPRTPS